MPQLPSTRLLLLAMITGASALPAAVHSMLACRLELIAMDMAAVDFDNDAGFSESQSTWLCCPHASSSTSSDCHVLFGAEVSTFAMSLAGENVTLRVEVPAEGRQRGRNVVELKRGPRSSFGDHPAVQPALVTFDSPTIFGPSTGARGHHRNLQATPTSGGALFLNRSKFWGDRSVLSISVGVAFNSTTVSATWPAGKTCSTAALRSQMWDGVRFPVAASPWAYSPPCRTTDNACQFNIRDWVATTSRGAVTFNQSRSRELFLPNVPNWPADFCNWSAVWAALKAAVAADGRYVFESFNHVVAYVPKHCAVGQASLPGNRVLVVQCPLSGVRENFPAFATHELGHNVGFHHAGLLGGNEYGDFSSTMGYTSSDAASSITLAHRHMFKWLPGSDSGSLHVNTDINALRVDKNVTLALADVNRAGLPAGAVWGAKIDLGAVSYYVSYRGCTAYDSAARVGWCGVVQLSQRTNGDNHSLHIASLTTAGQSVSAGTAGFITVTLTAAVPRSLDPVSGTVSVKVRVNRSLL